MTKVDELLDDDVAADRSEVRGAIVMTLVSFAVIVGASILLLVGGIPVL